LKSISEFNKHAALGRPAAERYCREWSKELDAKGKELSEQLKNKRIDARTYNIKRSYLNTQIKELNSCVEKVNRK